MADSARAAPYVTRGGGARPGVAVKICGVTRPADARVAAEAGARYVGAILSPGFGRSVTAEHAAVYLEEAGGADDPVELVAVMVDPTAEAAASAAARAGAGLVQLHGDEPPEVLKALRELGPWRIWKAVAVAEPSDVERALDEYGPVADGLLFDAGSQADRGGGHGLVFPWEALARHRERIPRTLTLIVAGGLTPGNVSDAVRLLRPDVVDVSSGVESAHGVKDPDSVRAFVRRAAGPSAGADDRNAGISPGSSPP